MPAPFAVGARVDPTLWAILAFVINSFRCRTGPTRASSPAVETENPLSLLTTFLFPRRPPRLANPRPPGVAWSP